MKYAQTSQFQTNIVLTTNNVATGKGCQQIQWWVTHCSWINQYSNKKNWEQLNALSWTCWAAGLIFVEVFMMVWMLSWWCGCCHDGVEVVMMMWMLSWWCGGYHDGVDVVMMVWMLSWWCGGCHDDVEVVMMLWRLSWWCGDCHDGVEVVMMVWRVSWWYADYLKDHSAKELRKFVTCWSKLD